MKKILIKLAKQKNLQEKMVWSTGTTLLLLFGLYGFLMNATVMNIVGMEQAQAKASSINGTLSQLQYEYTEMSSKLDIAYAKKLDLHTIEDPTYSKRPSENAFAFAR